MAFWRPDRAMQQQAFSCNQGPVSLEYFAGPVQINELAFCFKAKPFLTLRALILIPSE